MSMNLNVHLTNEEIVVELTSYVKPTSELSDIYGVLKISSSSNVDMTLFLNENNVNLLQKELKKLSSRFKAMRNKEQKDTLNEVL